MCFVAIPAWFSHYGSHHLRLMLVFYNYIYDQKYNYYYFPNVVPNRTENVSTQMMVQGRRKRKVKNICICINVCIQIDAVVLVSQKQLDNIALNLTLCMCKLFVCPKHIYLNSCNGAHKRANTNGVISASTGAFALFYSFFRFLILI